MSIEEVEPEMNPRQQAVDAILRRLLADLKPHLDNRGSFLLHVELDGMNFHIDHFSLGATPEIVMMSQVADIGAQAFISKIVGFEVGVAAVAMPKSEMGGNRTTLDFSDMPPPSQENKE